MIAVGGYAFQTAELDGLAGETHLGATFTSAPDDLLGQRPAGQSLHPALVREMLIERGTNPLLVEAFRDHPMGEPSARAGHKPCCRPHTFANSVDRALSGLSL